LFLLTRGPWRREQNRGGSGGRFPARFGPGGEGKVGEELEETELYPFVGSNEVGDGRRGTPRGSSGRRRRQAAAAALRRGETAVGWSGSFTKPWRS